MERGGGRTETPARKAVAEELAREPELVGATRQLDWLQQLQVESNVRDYRALLARIGVEHPMYWAAFVYYGVPVDLSGGAGALPEGIAARLPEMARGGDR